jgi:hypothetical protein
VTTSLLAGSVSNASRADIFVKSQPTVSPKEFHLVWLGLMGFVIGKPQSSWCLCNSDCMMLDWEKQLTKVLTFFTVGITSAHVHMDGRPYRSAVPSLWKGLLRLVWKRTFANAPAALRRVLAYEQPPTTTQIQYIGVQKI